MALKGRTKIYTDVDSVTKENVIEVMKKTFTTHEHNRSDIQYLLDYEKENQDLVREKTVRPEIDIISKLNLANEISEFNLGYFWGNPVALVQKSDKNPKGSNPLTDNNAITLLNEMYTAEGKIGKDQELARYIEICGVGYQMIDIKRDYEDGESVFDLVTLNPLFTYVVYSSNIYHKPILGVTYTIKEDFSKTFYCYTKDSYFIVDSSWKIVNGKKKKELDYFHRDRSGEENPIGEVSIIEFERAYDRMGCFERQISQMNALNVLISDLVNDVAQNTQAIWWGNDIKLENEDGEIAGVQGGQWILTQTSGQGTKPNIEPLVLQYNYEGVLANIQTSKANILESAYIPNQSDPGGGSTTGAMSLSSGWSASEAVASKKALVLTNQFQLRNKLVLKAIKKSGDISQDSPLLGLKSTDIEIRFIRQKTFDMATKINSMSTMVKNMVHPRVAMTAIDFFPNLAEAVEDSVDMMLKYQESILKGNEKAEATSTNNGNNSDPDRIMADMSDQTENTPITDI